MVSEIFGESAAGKTIVDLFWDCNLKIHSRKICDLFKVDNCGNFCDQNLYYFKNS